MAFLRISISLTVGGARGAIQRKLNRETATFEVLEVVEFDSTLGGFNGFEVDVAESVSVRHCVSSCH